MRTVHTASLVFLLGLLFGVPTILFAQTGIGSDLSVLIRPENPRAGALVELEAENYLIDLNSADFVWSVNGEIRKEGKGEKKFSVRLGALGTVTEVSVTATAIGGQVLIKNLSFNPAEVDLLWQTNGYTPPFYKGKALFPYQGTVLVAALPQFADKDGGLIPSKDLIYTWKEGDTVIGDSSGLGRNLFVFRGEIPIRDKTVSVIVATIDGTQRASESLTVSPIAPRLLLFENHPLYGFRFERALMEGFELSGEETKIAAFPFYFEVFKRAHSDLTYKWGLNYRALPDEHLPEIIIRRVTIGGGSSLISANAESKSHSFQAANNKLSVLFPDVTEQYR